MPHSIEPVFREELLCGEGPVWRAEESSLYFTDADASAVFRLDAATGTSALLTQAFASASLCLHADEGLVACGRGGIAHLGPDGSVRPAGVATAEGIPVICLNDITADPQGRIYTGQNCFDPHRPYEPGYLFSVDTDGTARVQAEGVHQGNGMAFSPDRSTFYFTDSVQRTIDRMDHDPLSGTLANRRTLIRFSPEEGLPDGLEVDAEGFLWSALFYGSCLVRIDPDGVVERRLRLPVSQPTSLAFGDADLTSIYLTSESLFTESALTPPGLNRQGPRGGMVYRIRQEIAGLPPLRARLRFSVSDSPV